MQYSESRKLNRRDLLLTNLSGIDKVDATKLVNVIINLQDRIQILEYELKNIKFDINLEKFNKELEENKLTNPSNSSKMKE